MDDKALEKTNRYEKLLIKYVKRLKRKRNALYKRRDTIMLMEMKKQVPHAFDAINESNRDLPEKACQRIELLDGRIALINRSIRKCRSCNTKLMQH